MDRVLMRFEDALGLLRSGHRIARAHWSGMYIEAPQGHKAFIVISADRPDNRSDFAVTSDALFADDWCEYAPNQPATPFGEDDYAR